MGLRRSLWDIVSGRRWQRGKALTGVMEGVVERAHGLDRELLREWVSTAAWAGAFKVDFLFIDGMLSGPTPTTAGLGRLVAVLAADTVYRFLRNEAHRRIISTSCAMGADQFAQTALQCFDPYGLTCYSVLAKLPDDDPCYAIDLARIVAVAVWQPQNPRVYESAEEQARDGAPLFPGGPARTFSLYADLTNWYVSIFLPRLSLKSWGRAARAMG